MCALKKKKKERNEVDRRSRKYFELNHLGSRPFTCPPPLRCDWGKGSESDSRRRGG
jgi:hypothetical protein